MRGKAIGLVIVVLALLLVATPGLTAAKGGQGGASFHIYGKIVALDFDALSIGVLVESPDSLYGETVTVWTTAYTHFKECDGGVSKGIKFDDLVVGRPVRVAGAVEGGIYIATRVIQYVPEE